MIKTKCFICLKILKGKGAIILSPPKNIETLATLVDTTDKYHICRKCWENSLQKIILALQYSAKERQM